MERTLNPQLIVATAAELAAINQPFAGHEYIFNTTTRELRKGPGLWSDCTPMLSGHVATRYVCKFTQDGTDPGVPTNILGAIGDLAGDTAFAYTSNKNVITGTDAFPAGRTVVRVTPLGATGVVPTVELVDEDTLNIGFRAATDGSAVDGVDFLLEIDIYPA